MVYLWNGSVIGLFTHSVIRLVVSHLNGSLFLLTIFLIFFAAWFSQVVDGKYIEWFSNQLVHGPFTHSEVHLVAGPSYEQLSLLVDGPFNCMV